MEPQEPVDEFFVEAAEAIVKSQIGSILNDVSYNSEKVNDWSNNIIDSSLKGLQSLNHPYKYAITATLMEKNGAGLVSACSSFWDVRCDGLCKVSWQNNTMHCLVAVFGMSLNIESEQME
jgi:dynein light chain Tctex-type 1